MPDVRMTWPNFLRHEVVVDGRRVRLTPQQASIFAVLFISRGRPMTHLALIDAVWPDPDLEPEYPERLLDVQLSCIRQKIPGVLVTHGCKTGWMIELPKSVQ